MEFLKNIVSAIKLSIVSQFALFLSSGLLLVLPISLFEQFGAVELLKTIKPFCLFVLIISGCFIIANIVGLIINSLKRLKSDIVYRKKIERRLKSLSIEEKYVMLAYILEDKNTLYFCSADGLIDGLAKDNVIVPTSYVTTLGRVSFNINLIAKDVLLKNLGKFISVHEQEDFKNLKYNAEHESNLRGNPLARFKGL